MAATVHIKICGVTNAEILTACAEAGAKYVGLNFYPPSPRSIAPDAAADLARQAPPAVKLVGVFVDPTYEELEAILVRAPLDMIQLHGSEIPARVMEIKARYATPVIKAIPVATSADVIAARAYESVADYLMFDAKPPRNVTVLPGGTGLAFDWKILAKQKFNVPWFLAGGLTPDNVAEAVRITGAHYVDCASGVESRPGVKDKNLIAKFISAAQGK